MELLSDLYNQLRAHYFALHWYHGFVWLVGWYFFATWPIAWLASRLTHALNQGEKTWEHAAYIGWALGFAAHIVLWVVYGLDAVPLTWHWGAPGDPGYWIPSSGLQYLVASLAVVPYVLIFLLDAYLVVRFGLRAGRVAS